MTGQRRRHNSTRLCRACFISETPYFCSFPYRNKACTLHIHRSCDGSLKTSKQRLYHNHLSGLIRRAGTRRGWKMACYGVLHLREQCCSLSAGASSVLTRLSMYSPRPIVMLFVIIGRNNEIINNILKLHKSPSNVLFIMYFGTFNPFGSEL